MSTLKKIDLDNDSGFDGSRDDQSLVSANTVAHDDHNKNEQFTIAKAETKAVSWFRLAFFAFLGALMAIVGYFVYTYVSESEQAEFEDDFHADAFKVFESIGKSLDVTIGAVDAFVVSMVSFARYSNSSWPFVTYTR
jgi:H+/Cl- antiporter ClcA